MTIHQLSAIVTRINEKRTGMGLRQNGCDDDKGYVITPKRDVITTKGMRLRQKGCDHD
jgi:hypothetical protein